MRAETANGLRLPIGAASPLVQRYQTRLTDRPARQMAIMRGATVGGSGAVNGGYFCRGLPRDFDGFGMPGWAWSDVVDHFRAIETDLDFTGPAHGDSGPILIRRTHEIVGSTATFVDAARRHGFGWLPDLNDGSGADALPSGVGAVPLNIVDGTRIGPGAAYLLPALERANLSLLTQTRALRLRIAGGRATGVDAIGPGGPITMTADRIVLSAGAIESAHLLMLSGIGDEAMLRGGRGGHDRPVAGRHGLQRSPGMGAADHLDGATWTAGARSRAQHARRTSRYGRIPVASSRWSATGRRAIRTGRISGWR